MPPPEETATKLFPSADEATEVQLFVRAPVCVQVWAEAERMPINKPQGTTAAERANLKKSMASAFDILTL
jgi:hypothetical protein